MQKIWSIRVPTGYVYAELLNLWIEAEYSTCPKCGLAKTEPYDHIEVEWDQGTDQIADFTFIIGPVVLKSDVADELLKYFGGFTKGEIRMPDHPNLRRPQRITKRTRKRVWLPYEGPDLCYMRITREVDFHSSSTVEIESSCDECGIVIYKKFEGIEVKNSARHTPREPGKGFFFNESDLAGADFFRPRHTGFTLCNERARQFITEKRYTNIEFLEVGDILHEK